jgi:hypothetical protein
MSDVCSGKWWEILIIRLNSKPNWKGTLLVTVKVVLWSANSQNHAYDARMASITVVQPVYYIHFPWGSYQQCAGKVQYLQMALIGIPWYALTPLRKLEGVKLRQSRSSWSASSRWLNQGQPGKGLSPNTQEYACIMLRVA